MYTSPLNRDAISGKVRRVPLPCRVVLIGLLDLH